MPKHNIMYVACLQTSGFGHLQPRPRGSLPGKLSVKQKVEWMSKQEKHLVNSMNIMQAFKANAVCDPPIIL
jgi:hypothetical protein